MQRGEGGGVDFELKGFRVLGVGFVVQGLWFLVSGSSFRVQGFGISSGGTGFGTSVSVLGVRYRLWDFKSGFGFSGVPGCGGSG